MSLVIITILLVLGILVLAGPAIESLIDRFWPASDDPGPKVSAVRACGPGQHCSMADVAAPEPGAADRRDRRRDNHEIQHGQNGRAVQRHLSRVGER